jgi:hypothetical protein
MQYPLVFSAEHEKPRFSFLNRGFAVLRQPFNAKTERRKPVCMSPLCKQFGG